MATVDNQSTQGGPSLEDILFRSLDLLSDQPALVDREEFADHIEEVFGTDQMSSEAFADRFFRGDDALAMQRPADLAAAVVQATKKRMQVYEFDLDRFEYVVLEEEDKVVVVSDLGTFAVDKDDTVAASIERAVIPESKDVNRASSGAQPRAYLIKADGTMVALDVPKLAGALDKLALRQVSLPAIAAPSTRLMQFAPTSGPLDAEREAELLRQDPRGRQAFAQSPDLNAILAGMLATAKAEESKEPPAGATASVFLVLPDGSLARPAMGSATRWKDMVSDWVVRAAVMSFGQTKSVQATGADRFAVLGNELVGLTSGGPAAGYPGVVGQRAEGSSEAISLGRSGGASIRVLGDSELALAISRGAVVVPGLAATSPGDRFWVQPESFFAPTSEDKQRASRDLLGLDGGQPTLVAGGPGNKEAPKLGAITGDPWSDWALTTGGSVGAEELMLAANSRDKTGTLSSSAKGRVFMAALARADATGAEVMQGPDGRELRLPSGEPVVAFRAPDGSFVLQRSLPALRLAEIGRPDGGEGSGLEGFAPSALGNVGSRSGSLPSTLFAALSLALERSAGLGGFKMPPVRIWANPDAMSVGEKWQLAANDPRRSSAMLAGAPSIYDGAAGQVGRLLLSLPFPNAGELHVGQDLGDALQSMLQAPVQPAGTSVAGTPIGFGSGRFSGTETTGMPAAGARAIAGPAAGASSGVAVRFAPGSGGSFAGGLGSIPTLGDFDLGGVHGQASRQARRAMVTLNLPSMAGLVAGSPSVAGLPGLLARAIEASDSWEAGPGAPLPSAIQKFAMRGPVGELVLPPPQQQAEAEPARRPLSAGEDEIVIPMPLWAQMGRGRISSTEQIMASRVNQTGYAPPLGAYRLVVPGSGPLDFADGMAPGTPGVAQVAGPTRLDLVVDPQRGSVAAQAGGGRYTLANVAVEGQGPEQVERRRIRIGAPLGTEEFGRAASTGTAVTSLADEAPSGALVVPGSPEARRIAAARPPADAGPSDPAARRAEGDAGRSAEPQAARRVEAETARRVETERKADDAHRDAVKQTEATQSAQREAKEAAAAQPQQNAAVAGPSSETPAQPRAAAEPSEELAPRRAPGQDADRPFSAALQGALRTSDEIASRLQPIASQGPGSGSLSTSMGLPGMPLVASPARSEAKANTSSGEASPSESSGGSASSSPSSSSSSRSSARPSSSASPSSPSSFATPSFGTDAPRTSSASSAAPGAVGSDSGASSRFTPSSPSSPSRPAVQSARLESESSEAVRAADGATRRASSRSDAIGGLPPGAWSGARRGDRNYAAWNYSRMSSSASVVNYNGIPLSTGLARPNYPTLPTSLRFRYVAAPLWWTGGSRGGRGVGAPGGYDGASESSEGVWSSEGPASSSSRALRAGLRAANSAATLWRSILVRAPSEGSSGNRRSDGSFSSESDAGGMDRSWDASASQLSSLAGRFDALNGMNLVEGQPPPQATAKQDTDYSAGAVGNAASVAASARSVGRGPSSLYVAVDKAGRGGLVDPRTHVMNGISNLQMNIVAAVPPQPPSMETMVELSQAHTRRKSAGGEADAPAEGGGGDAKAAPSSKIEGSVEAIAQRIYHRIRRRIASDRERFGG